MGRHDFDTYLILLKQKYVEHSVTLYKISKNWRWAGKLTGGQNRLKFFVIVFCSRLGIIFTFSESVSFSESNGKAFMAVSFSGPKLQATAQRVEVFQQ